MYIIAWQMCQQIFRPDDAQSLVTAAHNTSPFDPEP